MVANARSSMGFRNLGITLPPLWVMILLPLSVFAAAALSIYVFGLNAPIWMSNAFTVTALLRNKRSTWPVLLLLTTAADYAEQVVRGTPIIGLGLVACDSFEILLVATLVEFTGVVSSIESIWPMARLALVCLVVPTVSAAGGASLIALVHGAPFFANWKIWYFSTACGLLIITPLLLSWTDPALRKNYSGGVMVQTVILAGLVALVGYLEFHEIIPGLFLAFPVLLVATFNGRLLGATTAAAAMAAVAIWSTMAGHGPIAMLAYTSANAKVQILQLYIVVVLLSTLPVAVILAQREQLTAQRENLVAELRETTREAQAAVRAKSEFLAVMSHEIRTPMTGVLGMADLLMNADLPAKERGYVREIRASGRHLLELINDILDFSRSEAGKLDLEIVDFSLPELLEQARLLLAPQAAERGLDLRFELKSHSPPVLRGDPTRLKQVLVNLVGNGLKFTQRGGVTVSVSDRAVKNERDRSRFEIRDTGIGIPEEKLALLFNTFSQVDSSTTRKCGGSGLGLAICKKLVEAMGGEIGVESLPGVGSLFWFEVPLELGKNAAIPAPARHAFVAGVSRRVLLAEDVETNQMLITDMLRAYGYDVSLAVNGMEAVALAARERFDVVLMDVQMPVMDGIEATLRIRKLPPPAGDVPVIALSASMMPGDRERCTAAGMNGALTKPIDWLQLFETLAQYSGPGKTAANHEAASSPGADLPVPQPDATTALATALPDIDSPIDPAVFERLRHLQDKSGDLTLKLGEIFMRDTGRRLEELRDAVHRADAPAIARMAHAIKGSAANLGARIMVRICEGIEVCAEAADLDTMLTRMEELQSEFTRACDALIAQPTEP